MNFSEAITQYNVLKKLYDQKKLNAKDFESEVNDLIVTDGQGVEWKIGVRSGKWYFHDGQSWVEGDPQRKTRRSASPEHIDTVSGPAPYPTRTPVQRQPGGKPRLSTIALVGIIISAVALVAVIVVGAILELPKHYLGRQQTVHSTDGSQHQPAENCHQTTADGHTHSHTHTRRSHPGRDGCQPHGEQRVFPRTHTRYMDHDRRAHQ